MNIDLKLKNRITSDFYQWTIDFPRPLPWKGERDPYKIWLSEILLQQTQVIRGAEYYKSFTSRYINIKELADANDDNVFKLWEGLGYYSRCRNMLKAARFIVSERNGVFPSTYADILELPGVGPYTAAAIASFAFDLPQAVLDGNVYRVYARLFGVDILTNTPAAKSHFQDIANQMLDHKSPAQFNQVIMDFGATHCTPRRAKCESCPLQDICVAYQEDRVHELPIKKAALKKRDRQFAYLVICDEQENTIVYKRAEGDIWAGLYSFPLIELSENCNFEYALETFLSDLGLESLNSVQKPSKTYKQTLSHQKIFGSFYGIRVKSVSQCRLPAETATEIVSWSSLELLAFPRLIRHYLEERTNSLFEY